jgi:hypothetical protein
MVLLYKAIMLVNYQNLLIKIGLINMEIYTASMHDML